MANYILFGMLLAIVSFSVVMLCVQTALLFWDVRKILKTVDKLTERLDPTIQEVNQILHKSNLALDEAGNTYKNANQNLGEAKGKAKSLKVKVKHSIEALKTGVTTGVDVFKSGGQEPTLPEVVAESPANEELVSA